MEDGKEMKEFGFANGDHVLIILAKRESKRAENVEPLIVGGLDLTDLPEFGGLLVKKDVQFINEASLPESVPGDGNGQAEVRREEMGMGEIDFRVRFKNEIDTIKEMGFEGEERIMMALVASNGNLERAMDSLV